MEEHITGFDQHTVAAGDQAEFGGVDPGRGLDPQRRAARGQGVRKIRQMRGQCSGGQLHALLHGGVDTAGMGLVVAQ